MEYVPEADAAADLSALAESDGRASVETPPLLAMLRAYLESVALVADADAVDPETGAVTLMTLHASKGLEFKAVAIIGLEEGLLPHGRASESAAELEEERRLCFVGITRAMERLLITSAAYRTQRGMMDRTIGSRFLEELPEAHLKVSDESVGDRGSSTLDDYAGGYEPHADESDELGGLREGMMVRHPRFGVGRVESILSRGPKPRVRIAFTQAGVKTIVLGFAPWRRWSELASPGMINRGMAFCLTRAHDLGVTSVGRRRAGSTVEIASTPPPKADVFPTAPERSEVPAAGRNVAATLLAGHTSDALGARRAALRRVVAPLRLPRVVHDLPPHHRQQHLRLAQLRVA